MGKMSLPKMDDRTRIGVNGMTDQTKETLGKTLWWMDKMPERWEKYLRTKKRYST